MQNVDDCAPYHRHIIILSGTPYHHHIIKCSLSSSNYPMPTIIIISSDHQVLTLNHHIIRCSLVETTFILLVTVSTVNLLSVAIFILSDQNHRHQNHRSYCHQLKSLFFLHMI